MSDSDKLKELATESLGKLLSSLNYEYTLECSTCEEGLSLMISSPQASFLIGDNGDRLDDLQYLVNRSLQSLWEEAPRVRIDCESYRARVEEKLLRRACSRAESVMDSGVPLRMEPLNAYQRRLVHNALAKIEGIATESEETESRFKRITILRK